MFFTLKLIIKVATMAVSSFSFFYIRATYFVASIDTKCTVQSVRCCVNDSHASRTRISRQHVDLEFFILWTKCSNTIYDVSSYSRFESRHKTSRPINSDITDKNRTAGIIYVDLVCRRWIIVCHASDLGGMPSWSNFSRSMHGLVDLQCVLRWRKKTTQFHDDRYKRS